jgi:hypothetical protein
MSISLHHLRCDISQRFAGQQRRHHRCFGIVGGQRRRASIASDDHRSGRIAYKLVALPSITNVRPQKANHRFDRIGAGTDHALKSYCRISPTPGKDVQLIPTGISESTADS